jgi:hypothetical protein
MLRSSSWGVGGGWCVFDVVVLVLSVVVSLYVLYLECGTWKADRVLSSAAILKQASFRKSQRLCFHTRGRAETKTAPGRLLGID